MNYLIYDKYCGVQRGCTRPPRTPRWLVGQSGIYLFCFYPFCRSGCLCQHLLYKALRLSEQQPSKTIKVQGLVQDETGLEVIGASIRLKSNLAKGATTGTMVIYFEAQPTICWLFRIWVSKTELKPEAQMNVIAYSPMLSY